MDGNLHSERGMVSVYAHTSIIIYMIYIIYVIIYIYNDPMTELEKGLTPNDTCS